MTFASFEISNAYRLNTLELSPSHYQYNNLQATPSTKKTKTKTNKQLNKPTKSYLLLGKNESCTFLSSVLQFPQMIFDRNHDQLIKNLCVNEEHQMFPHKKNNDRT